MRFRQSGRRNTAGKVFFLAEDIRPIERQFRLLLFEETPGERGVPYNLVVLAGGDVRAVAEGIGGVAPQPEAAGQVGVGIQSETVIAGVIGGLAQKIGGVAETPVAVRSKPPHSGW